jgi:hypothetical protein
MRTENQPTFWSVSLNILAAASGSLVAIYLTTSAEPRVREVLTYFFVIYTFTSIANRLATLARSHLGKPKAAEHI